MLRLRIGIDHVEAEIDYHFFMGLEDAISVAVNRLEIAFVEHHLNIILIGLLRLGFIGHERTSFRWGGDYAR